MSLFTDLVEYFAMFGPQAVDEPEYVELETWARVVEPKTGAGWWHRLSDTRILACGIPLEWDDELDRITKIEGSWIGIAGAVCPRCENGERWEFES